MNDTVYVHNLTLDVEAEVPHAALGQHLAAPGWQEGRLPGRAEEAEQVAAAELAAAEEARHVDAVAEAVKRLLEQPNAEVDAFGNPLPPIPDDVLADARQQVQATQSEAEQPVVVLFDPPIADVDQTPDETVPTQGDDEPTVTPERGRNPR